jgi:hypothetical protein
MSLIKRLGILCIVIICTGNVFSQKSPIKFGKIGEDEIKMTVYEKDTSAAAVVIADYGEVEIVYVSNIGFQLNYSRHKRIKILKNDGLDKANVVIRLYKSSSGQEENVSSLKASTYNIENGKLLETKFAKKDLIREEESKNYILRKFALPNVKVGSIIEYDYSYSSPYYYNIPNWYFQEDVPVIWSEYRTAIPEFYDFKRATGGFITAEISEEKAYPTTLPGTTFQYVNNYTRMVYKNVPAFRNEKYITTPNDYMAKVEFEIRSVKFPNSMIQNYSTTWAEIGKKLLEDENFGLALNRHGIVKELTEQINPADSVEKKIAVAYDLIKRNIKWDETHRIFTYNTLRAAFNKHEGNMAEVNLLLVNLLRSVGIEAHPVLFSTRRNGVVKMFYPMISSFNGVLACARVNGKNMLLDATSGFLKPGEIPTAYINGNGLKIMENKVEWVPLLNSEQIMISNMVSLNIVDNQVKGVVVKNSQSSSATILRGKIAREGKQQYIDNFVKKITDWEIKDYKIENEDDIMKSLVEKIEIENFNHLDASADIIYLPAIVTAEMEENPFKSDERKFPVDFAVPVNERNILNINIPEGYVVEELPASVVYVLPDNAAQFVYKSQQNGSIIQIFSQLKITKTYYQPHEYKLLKEFYKNMISKHGEQIVLKKV